MKNLLSAFWKILLLTIVFFVVNSVMGVLLPISYDMMADLSPQEQAAFMPLYLLTIFVNMTVMLLVFTHLRFKGWKLFFGVWMAFWGVFSVVNAIELFWYNESFPMFTYLDVTMMMIQDLVSYGVTVLVGMALVKGFKRDEQAAETTFMAGRYGWRIILFCLVYPPFYFCCGFIPWVFPEVREFYAAWVATTEPMYVLLLFNIFRGALWLASSLPVLMGVRTRKQAFWLMPLTLFAGTAVSLIPPSMMPGIVRFGHFIELTISMVAVGLFMAWLFLKDSAEYAPEPSSQTQSAAVPT